MKLTKENINITTNMITLIEEAIKDVIDEYELDYGNAEVYADDDKKGVSYVVEAPNNSTVGDYLTVEEMEEELEYYDTDDDVRDTIREIVKNRIKTSVSYFDADDEFDELYTTGMRIRPSEFIRMLQDDQDFFENLFD